MDTKQDFWTVMVIKKNGGTFQYFSKITVKKYPVKWIGDVFTFITYIYKTEDEARKLIYT